MTCLPGQVIKIQGLLRGVRGRAYAKEYKNHVSATKWGFLSWGVVGEVILIGKLGDFGISGKKKWEGICRPGDSTVGDIAEAHGVHFFTIFSWFRNIIV